MARQGLIFAKDQILRFIEANCPNRAEVQRLTVMDGRKLGFNRFRINLVRRVAGQAQHDGPVGAMAFSGERDRPIEFGLDSRHTFQQAFPFQFRDEIISGTHRPNRVRTRWANADLEDFEKARLHKRSRQSCYRSLLFHSPV